MTADVDTLVEKIDARGLRWQIYRGAMELPDPEAPDDATRKRKCWIVRIGEGADELTHQDRSLHAAVAWASEVAMIPIVPRRPIVTGRWEVRKAGPGKWDIHADGHFQLQLSTKRAAEERIALATESQHNKAYDWDTEWAHLVATGVEGVDFRWKA